DPFDFEETTVDGDPRDADVAAVMVGINNVYPVEVEDWGPTVFGGPFVPPTDIWFQYLIGPGTPPKAGIPPYTVQFDRNYNGLNFDADVQATITNTEKWNGSAWVPTVAGDWNAGKLVTAGIYRTKVTYSQQHGGANLDPAIKVIDTNGPQPGYDIYWWQNAFTVIVDWTENWDTVGMTRWTQAGNGTVNWHLDSTYKWSNPYGMTCNNGVDFAGNWSVSLTLNASEAIDATTYDKIQFRHRSITEGGGDGAYYDRCEVQLSINNFSSYTNIVSLGSTGGSWVQRTFDIPTALRQPNLRIRLYFITGDSLFNNYYGHTFDDIRLFQFVLNPAVWTENFESGIGSWTLVSQGGSTSWQNRNVNHYYGQGAHGGSWYLATVPQPYTNSSYHWLQRGPISGFSTNTNYTLDFWASGYTENNYDGTIFQISTNGTTWTNLGTQYIYGHGGGPYYGFWINQNNVWVQKFGNSFNTGSSTQVWIRLGWEADSSVTYGGPAIDDIAIRPS
ncbi:MAG: hypothetical protein HRF49_03380, partial [bacterium]